MTIGTGLEHGNSIKTISAIDPGTAVVEMVLILPRIDLVQMEERAGVEGITVSHLFRILVRNYLERTTEPIPPPDPS